MLYANYRQKCSKISFVDAEKLTSHRMIITCMLHLRALNGMHELRNAEKIWRAGRSPDYHNMYHMRTIPNIHQCRYKRATLIWHNISINFTQKFTVIIDIRHIHQVAYGL